MKKKVKTKRITKTAIRPETNDQRLSRMLDALEKSLSLLDASLREKPVRPVRRSDLRRGRTKRA